MATHFIYKIAKLNTPHVFLIKREKYFSTLILLFEKTFKV